MSERLGFAGLGNLGGVLAGRLIECGFDVNVFDVVPEKVKELEASGGKGVSTIKELCEKSSVVLTSLPAPKVVEDVYFGKDGILENLSEGSCVIELSTIDVETMKKIDKAAKEKNIHVIDSAISAGIPECKTGNAVLLVGAEDEVLAKYRPILEALAGDKIHHVGIPGDGKAIKLVNNIMSLGSVLLGSEAFLMGVQSGIDPQKLYDVLTKCAGRSFQFTKRMPKWIENDFKAGFSIDMGTKDLKLGLDMAEKMGRQIPIAEHVYQYFHEAQDDGNGKLDVIAITKTVEKKAK